MVTKRIIELFSRIIVGTVFIFSGFVKAVDPLGYTYKLTDYFEAFSIDFFNPLAMPLSFFISALEFAVGMALLLNILKRFTSWLMFSIMIYFTGLTLIVAITNPISDCGCFGDAIKLDNWTTFYKNIVLLGLTFPILYINDFKNRVYHLRTQRILWGAFFTFSIGISLYCVLTLPLLDFRPYKIGVNIYDAMNTPEGAPEDVYKTTLYYEKDGEIKGFPEDDYPWQDSTWRFVEMESEIIEKGYVPPISGFHVMNRNGENIGLDIITNDNYQLLIISTNLSKISGAAIEKIRALKNIGIKKKYELYIVSSASGSEIEHFKFLSSLDVEMLQADETFLKTIIRSNPGVLILKDGIIIGKYNLNRVVVDDKFNKLLEHTLSSQRVIRNRYKVLTLALAFLVLLLVYVNLEKKY